MHLNRVEMGARVHTVEIKAEDVKKFYFTVGYLQAGTEVTFPTENQLRKNEVS